MTEITCKCGCGRKKMVRVADVKRGWGKFYSKSCKAKKQEQDTGQYKAYQRGCGVSHAAKRRGEDPIKAVQSYIGYEENSLHPYGYGHPFVSGDEGHGQE